ncbi:TonB-dependent receptor family protein [Sinimarinibacterium thermocellulolyticum]|uniref:TonB-dependent receptor n=1 Tax=Sinimarinibacterium thermocellulolyticum TaxID=3170016 RepID=A0ABV2ACQ6_9GAMM
MRIVVALAVAMTPAISTFAVHAQQTLPPLEVRSPRIELPWSQTPAAVGAVSANELRGDPQLALDEALVRIPGIYAQNRYNLNQGLRLSIRGFGSRASFGVRGIRVLVDEVPLTMPDGQTDLDALDLALLHGVEVLRGPTSALYGNGAGGVVALRTRDVPELRHGRVDLVAGELGERRWRVEAGGIGERFSGLAAVARRELDGHRDNMAADSTIASGRLRAALGGGVLELSLHTLDIDALDPGALTRAEADADPSAANPAALRFAVGESIEQQRLASHWSRAIGEATEIALRGWIGERDFANRLPFARGGQTVFDRRFGGIGVALDHRFTTAGLTHTLSIGGDFESQRDARARFDNAEGGVRGAQTLDQDEKARGLGLFVVDQIELGGPWLAALGLRHDEIRLAVDDAFIDDGDDSGRRVFDETSVNLGLGYRLGDSALLYTRYGSGFETPTNNELANPAGGGFNPDLESAAARNLEAGVKFALATLRAELAIYRVRNDDELVRFELDDQPGRSFYRNAGATERDGVELGVAWQALPSLMLSGAYSFNDYRYEQYRLGDDDFGGKAIPGIPRQQLFVETAWTPQPGWLARVQAVALDRVFADDANEARVSGYLVANARLSWEGRVGDVTLRPWLALNNVFDTDYTDNLRVNAFGGRYYEPAAGRTLITGVELLL